MKITKEYISNIDTTVDVNSTRRHLTYWYKFYTYCWLTHVRVKCVPFGDDLVERSLSAELLAFNATLSYTQNAYKCYKVTFNTEEDYNNFVEHWR